MRDKFVTENYEIDLSRLRTNFTEENPRFKDSVWMKYTLPVDIHYDREFKSKLGQYSSFINENLPKVHKGNHIFMGKTRTGQIEFSDIRNQKCTIQINSGFDDLPNSEKRLSELPFETIVVDDIYDHANEIVVKRYPATNYNFPKLYTGAYDLESEGYQYFDSFLNNRVKATGGSSKIFPRNEVEETVEGWDVINRNILVPLVYIMHILKVGFEDAGFVLQGDILEDSYLKQRCVFGNNQYSTTADQKYQKTYVYESEFYDSIPIGSNIYANWKKAFTIDAPGKYRLIGSCYTDNFEDCNLKIKRNGVEIAIYNSGNTNDKLSFNNIIEVSIEEAKEKQLIEFEYFGYAINDESNSEGVNIGVADININPIRTNSTSGEPIPFVFNFNEVNLKNAVPDWTFGEIVTLVKNWRNYDLTFDGNVAYMNRIVIDKTKEPEDFRMYEVKDPIRSKNDKKYFYIKFPEVEGVSLQNVYYSENGYQINPQTVSKDATVIDINGFCLPLYTFRGTTTARVFDESALMFVYYDGLNENGDNHAINPIGLHGEQFAKDNLDWFLTRLTNWTFKWTFNISKNKMRKFNIRSEIFCNQKKHLIKSWVVNSSSDKNYSVEIETETF